MSKQNVQVVKNGENMWMVWKYSPRFRTDEGYGVEYEQVARVVLENGRYYVELPQWGADGVDDWIRQPRPWALKEGAVASVAVRMGNISPLRRR